MRIVYLNGQYIEEQKAAIPISDRGFLYGDGLFTTALVENGNICHLDLHLERLYESCKDLQIRPPEFSKSVFDPLLALNNAKTGTWRLKILLSGGFETRLGLPVRDYGTVLATLSPFQRNDKPLSAAIYPSPIQALFSKYKTLAYLERLHLREWALQIGLDEVITFDSNQNLLECAFANLIWQIDGVWYTPESSLPLLKGVALQVLSRHWQKNNIPFRQVLAKLADIPAIANVYAVNALHGAVPIKSIDNMHFSIDPQLTMSLNRFLA